MRKRAPKAAAKSGKTAEELMIELQRGSHAAYLELYGMFERQVYAYSLRVLSDPDRAADVFQEAFVRLWVKRDSFRGGNVAAWFFTIVRNLCLNTRESERRRVDLDSIDEPAAEQREEDFIARDAVGAAIAKLPEEYREVIVLREYQGYAYQEIADLTGQSLSSVKVRIFRAKQQLRRHLAPLIQEGR